MKKQFLLKDMIKLINNPNIAEINLIDGKVYVDYINSGLNKKKKYDFVSKKRVERITRQLTKEKNIDKNMFIFSNNKFRLVLVCNYNYRLTIRKFVK